MVKNFSISIFALVCANPGLWAAPAVNTPRADRPATIAAASPAPNNLTSATPEPARSRFGVSYAGHLIYVNAIGVEGLWTLLDRGDKWLLRNVSFTSGIATLTTGKLVEIPVLFRAELFRLWYFGLEVSQGINITYFTGVSGQSSPLGIATVLCAAAPVTIGALRFQPEICLLPSTMNAANVGGSIYYAF